jgi:predicted O-methyltransferase YrrM
MTIYNDQISAYINGLFISEDAALQRARQESPKRGLPAIQIKPEEGRFLQFLVRASGAQRALEIGTLGGYSGIWIARGLPAGGKLITLEVETLHAQVASQHFAAAGVADRVEIRVGNAHELLKKLATEGPFDFMFIDAEKPGYPQYLDWALENVRLNGVIAAHNAFRKGSVAGLAEADKYTHIMQEFNRRFAQETRLISTIFPAGDGMLVGVKMSD